jgi:hypothetical protein
MKEREKVASDLQRSGYTQCLISLGRLTDSPDGHTFNLINHCLIDERHFSDVIEVMARSMVIYGYIDIDIVGK